MKLSKSYSFNKSKSDEIISFTFPFIGIRNRKTTPQLGDSPTRRVGETLREKRQHQNHIFAHKGRLFPCEIRGKRPEDDNFGLFLRPSIIALYKKSLLYFKSVDFLPKNDGYICSSIVVFIESLSIKKVQAIKVAKILT
jgi:hypothetical protein